MAFSFTAELWLWQARSDSWTFVSLPQDLSDEVEDARTEAPRGFGSLKVEVTIGATTWRTSLFPSQDEKTFVLPVKKAVRKAEGVGPGDEVEVSFVLVTS